MSISPYQKSQGAHQKNVQECSQLARLEIAKKHSKVANNLYLCMVIRKPNSLLPSKNYQMDLLQEAALPAMAHAAMILDKDNMN